MKFEYEYIVIGTGPGGAPVALELAKAGKKVLIIEKGAYHKKMLGLPFGARLNEGYFLFNSTIEGIGMSRGITVGGSSMIYQGNVYEPGDKFINMMGIDFRPEVKEIKNELGVKRLPKNFFGQNGSKGLQKMITVAAEMGSPFRAQDKFIDPDKCSKSCDYCMLGCSRDAKWTTRTCIEEAVNKHNAELMTSSQVNRLIFNENNKKVIGIELKNSKKIFANKVILAAGGIGSAGIMIRSGISNAGKNLFMDPMTIMYGFTDEKNGGSYGDPTFSYAIESHAEKDGFMIGNSKSLGTCMVMALKKGRINVKNLIKLPQYRQGMGLFVKIADQDKGKVYSNEKTSKIITDFDIQRMNNGLKLAKKIMINSGVNPESIILSRWAGGHPGGTVKMGKFVDRNFKTEFENLYICDASIIPESPGAPPSLAIMGMSRLLSKILLGRINPDERLV